LNQGVCEACAFGFTLDDNTCTTKCKNGKLDLGEQCDSGIEFNPGCQSCIVTRGWKCTGEPSTCVQMIIRCGDGIWSPSEACDDGSNDGIGCSWNCLGTALGYYCYGMDQSFCYLLCGDGYVDQEDNYAETCDDSNYLANDGCNASC